MPDKIYHYKKLISYLNEVPTVILYDREEIIIEKGGKYIKEISPWDQIKFSIQIYQFKESLQNFHDEFSNNQFSNDFNISHFCQIAISAFKELIIKFDSVNISGKAFKIRTDLIIKYLSRNEDEMVEDYDGQVVPKPKILILPSDQYKTIPISTLKTISDYFAYQQKFIKDILNLLKSNFINEETKRGYDTSYLIDYFNFDLSNIGSSGDANKCINDFFTALINKNYIEPGSIKKLNLFFNKNSTSIKEKRTIEKVKWLKSKQELFYLIKKLNDGGYIENLKRETSRIIVKVFVKKNGSEFLPKDFHGLHNPQNTSSLNDIISNLD